MGVTAEFGGVLGGRDAVAERGSVCNLPKAPLLNESRRRRPDPLSSCGSGMLEVVGDWEKRPAMVVLARLACLATGVSSSSGSSNTGGGPNLRLNGKVPVVDALVGD